MSVIDDARHSVAYEKAKKSGQSFKDHVIDCLGCRVGQDGMIYPCDVGLALQQIERKARLG
jgi:hypothetical protein